jgi:hypothetical protein
MHQRFPPIEAVSREWQNLADVSGLRKEDLLALLARFVPSENILVEVNRHVGGFFAKSQAIEFIAEHICKGNMRISNREFTGFVYIATSGVATGWSGA